MVHSLHRSPFILGHNVLLLGLPGILVGVLAATCISASPVSALSASLDLRADVLILSALSDSADASILGTSSRPITANVSGNIARPGSSAPAPPIAIPITPPPPSVIPP